MKRFAVLYVRDNRAFMPYPLTVHTVATTTGDGVS